MRKVIAHIDMDSFFCACEEKRYPNLKGKPVIVAGNSDRGVVCAANYVAREYKLHSAMPTKIAKLYCPKVICIPVDKDYYGEESNKIMDILRSFATDFRQASIDEAYLDVTNLALQFRSHEDLANYIKDEVYKQTSLTCSIGISNCKVTSKIASDFNKPNGITIVKSQADFLAPLPIEKMPGIGKKSSPEYRRLGIETIGDLKKIDKFVLIEKLGHRSIEFQQIATGDKHVQFSKEQPKKSISKEHTFFSDVSNIKDLLNNIDILCNNIHEELKTKFYKTVSIKLKYRDFTTITRDKSISTMDNSLENLKRLVKEAFLENYQENHSFRLIGVRLSNLTNYDGSQKSLTAFC